MINITKKLCISSSACFKEATASFTAVASVCVVAGFHYGFVNLAALSQPIQYEWDGIAGLAILKAAASGDLPLLRTVPIEGLGAPYGGDWNAWPIGRSIIWVMGGWLTTFVGVGAAANLLVLLAHGTAALAMYASLRWIRCSRLWSWVFAVCFGLAPFIFWRSWHHMPITFAYPVPIFCAACFHIFRGGAHFVCRAKNIIILITISLFVGGSIYYQAAYFGMLVVASFYLLTTEKSPRGAIITLVSAFILAAAFFAETWTVHYDTLTRGKNFEAVVRSYSAVQTCALKPVELLLPGPSSGIPGLSQLSQAYLNRDVFSGSGLRCEMFAPYLGLPGILSLGILLISTGYSVLSTRRPIISGWFWLVLGVLAFSVIGGLNGIIGLGGFYLLRSSNRYSIVILALVFCFLARYLTRNRFGKISSSLIASGFLTLAFGEALLRESRKQDANPAVPSLLNDRAFFSQLETLLPVGAFIFNYPPDRFPEGRLTYPELRGFVASDSLRFSYGSVAGRAREGWQTEVADLPAAQMVERLQEYGIGGVLVYTGRSLDREGNDELKNSTLQRLEELRQLGLNEISDSTGSFAFFVLNPAPMASWPAPPAYFAKGFWSSDFQPALASNQAEEQFRMRWAFEKAAIVEVYNESHEARWLIMSGELVGTPAASMKISTSDGRSLWEGVLSVGMGTKFSTEPVVVPAHSHVRVVFTSDARSFVSQGRKVFFGIGKLSLSWKPVNTP